MTADVELLVERVAEALWNASPGGHKLLAKAGYPTDWPSQPASVKRDYFKSARAAIAAQAAEIEALRAELDACTSLLLAETARADTQHDRAERLAEALRDTTHRLSRLCNDPDSPLRGKAASLVRDEWRNASALLCEQEEGPGAPPEILNQQV